MINFAEQTVMVRDSLRSEERRTPHDIKVEDLCYPLNHKPKKCISECSVILPCPVVFSITGSNLKNNTQDSKVVPHRITN